MIGGLILAGGRSSRFGREKALAELGGLPLIARVEAVLARGAAPLAVSAPPDCAAAGYAQARGLAVLADEAGDVDGPLAGVKAGLRWAEGLGLRGLVTSPCDTPFLPHDLVRRLQEGARAGAALACTPAGPQPLCALWPVTARTRIDALPGHPPIRLVLSRLDAAEIPFDDPDAFANLNTPDDYARAKSAL